MMSKQVNTISKRAVSASKTLEKTKQKWSDCSCKSP
jgi:hypothetical protein